MWGALVGKVVSLIWSLIQNLRPPAAPPVAQQLGAKEQQVIQETSANDQLQAAARARSDADARRVRDDPSAGKITTDPNAAINRDPDAHFRD
jgi:hypothetical protein